MTPHAKGNTLRRQWLLYSLRSGFPAGLVTIAILACLVWFLAVRPAQETEDMAGVPLRQETGAVAAVAYPKGQYPEVFVHIEEGTGSILTPDPFAIGQRVQVTYRVGKSGRVYIESLRPELRGENLADHAGMRH